MTVGIFFRPLQNQIWKGCVARSRVVWEFFWHKHSQKGNLFSPFALCAGSYGRQRFVSNLLAQKGRQGFVSNQLAQKGRRRFVSKVCLNRRAIISKHQMTVGTFLSSIAKSNLKGVCRVEPSFVGIFLT